LRSARKWAQGASTGHRGECALFILITWRRMPNVIARRWTVHDGCFFAQHVLRDGDGRAPVERQLLARARMSRREARDAASKQVGGGADGSRSESTAAGAVRSVWLMAGNYPQPVPSCKPRMEQTVHGSNLYARVWNKHFLQQLEEAAKKLSIRHRAAAPTGDELALAEAAHEARAPNEEVWLAAHQGNIEVVRGWLVAGGDVNGTLCLAGHGAHPHTLLAIGVTIQSVDLVIELIGQNAAVDLPGYRGSTPLHTACLKGHAGIVKLLIDAGAPINATDDLSMTSLMYAAIRGHLSTIRLLLGAGASRQACDASGGTALDHALTQDQGAAAVLLRRRISVGSVRSAQRAATRAQRAGRNLNSSALDERL